MPKNEIPKTEKEQNAIVAQNVQINGAGIELRTLADMKVAAETFINSGLCPAHFNTAAKVIVTMQAGAELGFGPWTSLQVMHVVKGKVGIESSAIGGLIRSRGKPKTMRQFYEGEEGTDDFKAVVISQRGADPSECRTEFSITDAKTAKLWNKKSSQGEDSTWVKYPKDMLMYRALSRHGRQFYGDVLCGVYTEHELAEIQEPQAQPTPDAGSREDRKQVDAKISDTQTVVRQELRELYIDMFIKKTQQDLSCNFELMGLSDTELWPVFAKLAKAILDPEMSTEIDYTEIEHYTLTNIVELRNALQLDGIPDDILKQIPVPAETVKEE